MNHQIALSSDVIHADTEAGTLTLKLPRDVLQKIQDGITTPALMDDPPPVYPDDAANVVPNVRRGPYISIGEIDMPSPPSPPPPKEPVKGIGVSIVIPL